MTPEERDASECALRAAKGIGLYAGWDISPEEFRARPCADLIGISGEECPFGEDFTSLVLVDFLNSMRMCLLNKGYVDPVVMVSLMCLPFDGALPTWGQWCDHVAQTLGV